MEETLTYKMSTNTCLLKHNYVIICTIDVILELTVSKTVTTLLYDELKFLFLKKL